MAFVRFPQARIDALAYEFKQIAIDNFVVLFILADIVAVRKLHLSDFADRLDVDVASLFHNLALGRLPRSFAAVEVAFGECPQLGMVATGREVNKRDFFAVPVIQHAAGAFVVVGNMFCVHTNQYPNFILIDSKRTLYLIYNIIIFHFKKVKTPDAARCSSSGGGAVAGRGLRPNRALYGSARTKEKNSSFSEGAVMSRTFVPSRFMR